jgi:hypothetical protein
MSKKIEHEDDYGVWIEEVEDDDDREATQQEKEDYMHLERNGGFDEELDFD